MGPWCSIDGDRSLSVASFRGTDADHERSGTIGPFASVLIWRTAQRLLLPNLSNAKSAASSRLRVQKLVHS
jgi:hypothetical protein